MAVLPSLVRVTAPTAGGWRKVFPKASSFLPAKTLTMPVHIRGDDVRLGAVPCGGGGTAHKGRGVFRWLGFRDERLVRRIHKGTAAHGFVDVPDLHKGLHARGEHEHGAVIGDADIGNAVLEALGEALAGEGVPHLHLAMFGNADDEPCGIGHLGGGDLAIVLEGRMSGWALSRFHACMKADGVAHMQRLAIAGDAHVQHRAGMGERAVASSLVVYWPT
jgi:hypothetical protein